jgi:single stranded DNA-binding protein
MNQITFNGHLARDPETRTVNNQEVVSFTVGSTSAVKNENGDYNTMWYSCSVWGKFGNRIANMHKGDPIMVTGSLNVRNYAKRDGTNAYSLDVRVTDYSLMGSPKRNEAGDAPAPAQSQPADDDLPF